MASRILHPDKVKDQTDERQKALMSEQFGKLTTARDMLLIPTVGTPAALAHAREKRRGYICRYLWTEEE